MARRLREAMASIDHLASLPEHASLPPAIVVFNDLPDRHVGPDVPDAFAGALHVFKRADYEFLNNAATPSQDASLAAIAEAMKLQATIPQRFQHGNELERFDHTY